MKNSMDTVSLLLIAYLTEDELFSLSKKTPMTFETFESLCDKLSTLGADKYFYGLLSDYPRFVAASAGKMLAGLPAGEDDGLMVTEEDIKKSLNKFRVKCQKEMGKFPD